MTEHQNIEYKKPKIDTDSNYQSDPEQQDFISPPRYTESAIAVSKNTANKSPTFFKDDESYESQCESDDSEKEWSKFVKNELATLNSKDDRLLIRAQRVIRRFLSNRKLEKGEDFESEEERNILSLLEQWADPLKKPLELNELKKLRDDLIHTLNEVNKNIKTLKNFHNRFD